MARHVSVYDDMAARKLGFEILRLSAARIFNESDALGVDLVCIGTDRATGDCLGPLVGDIMAPHVRETGSLRLYGTLERPVHATNLERTIESNRLPAPRRLLIAVDACLGKAANVGNITVGRGSLTPGASLSKELPALGDIFITGVVNARPEFPGMEAATLQSTRLGTVMRMARTISEGLILGLDLLPQAHVAPDGYCYIDGRR